MKTQVNLSESVSAGRGRPRSREAHEAILKATRALLDEHGPSGVTMEAIAARAGVGKPTLYRWWPNVQSLTMSVLMDASHLKSTDSQRTSAVNALKAQLKSMVLRLTGRTGRHVVSMLAAADTNSEMAKAFRSHFVLERRKEGKALLDQAVQNGEIRKISHVEVTLDLIYGPLFFRLLMGHAPLDDSFVDQLMADVLRGLQRTPRKVEPVSKRP